jgi:hypothetical protein
MHIDRTEEAGLSEVSSYDSYQRVFSMSWISNGLTAKLGTQDELTKKMFTDLSSYMSVPATTLSPALPVVTPSPETLRLIGNWSLEWGPAVYDATDRKLPARNVVFVARCADMPVVADNTNTYTETVDAYVVAIAATNADSIYDWIKEDGQVDSVVKWCDFKAAGNTPGRRPDGDKDDEVAYISAGTALGLSNILSKMPSPAWTTRNPNMSLGDYLAGLSGVANAKIFFAGHSLAGALSPGLAMYFRDRDPGKPLDKFADALVYPTAGATPGNRAFADAYAACFPKTTWVAPAENAKSWQQWNVRLWNHYDVVPHAWARTTHRDSDHKFSPFLEEIPGLYGNVLGDPVYTELATTVAGAIADTVISNMIYHTLPGGRLPGVKPKPAPETFEKFLEILVHQHVTAYVDGLILPVPLPKPQSA